MNLLERNSVLVLCLHMQVEPEGTVWTNPYQTCTELNLLSKAIDELLHSKTGPLNSLDREELYMTKGTAMERALQMQCHSPKKKIARRGAHRACRVSVSPASILVPRADHPQRQRPSSPRPVPPTALSTHQAPSPLPVPFFFLLTLPLTSSSSSSPPSPILVPQATKVQFLAQVIAPRAPPLIPQPGRPNSSPEQLP